MKHFAIAAFIGLWASLAHAYDGLDQTFDPRSLSSAEKQFLQELLAREGTYKARIDGAWGRGSQSALRTALPPKAANAPTWRQVATFSQSGRDRLKAEKWGAARKKGAGVSFLVPNALVQKGQSPDGALFAASDNSLSIRALSLNAPQALLLHTQITARGKRGGADYSIKRENVYVTTAQIRGGTRLYARSEQVEGTFETVVVEWQNSKSKHAQLVIASIQKGLRKRPALPDGVLKRAIKDLSKPKAPEKPASVPKTDVSDAPETAPKAIGVAFYINNTDMIAATRAVNKCDKGTLRHANGQKIRKISEIEALGLWVLSSNKRSASWVRLGQTGMSQGVQGFEGLVMERGGWDERKVERRTLNLFGSTEVAAGQTRFVTSVPSGRRSLGAPLFDASGHLAGVVLGRVEIDGLTPQQKQQLRPYTFASSTAGLPGILTGKNILFEGAQGHPGPVSGNESTLTAVYCDE